jgi:hypothetical protein
MVVGALVWLASMTASAQERPREVGEASDVWSEPNPGLRYLDRQTTTPCRIHAVIVELHAEGVHVVSTRYRERWRTVSSYAQSTGVQVAVNGGFWALMQGARGFAAGGGSVWPRNTEADPEMGELVIDDKGRVSLLPPGVPIDADWQPFIAEAVSGRPWLVHEGELVTDTLDAFETANDRAPRTAVGLDHDGMHLILAVVDGRQAESRGMTLYELGRLMAELGAEEAMNLDGGASSEMYVQELGGIVSVPSRGRWEIAVDDLIGEGQVVRETEHGREVLTRGREQEVINHIGIIAPSPVVPVQAGSTAFEGLAAPPPVLRPRPLPPRLHLGVMRESIALAVAYGGPVCGVGVLVWIVRAWRRRRARAGRA